MNSYIIISKAAMVLRGVFIVLSLMSVPSITLGQSPYPADNDADYYDNQYHTPVTPVNPVYEQPPNYPQDNDSDYYEYYYGTTNTDNGYGYPDNQPYYDPNYYPPQNPYYPPPNAYQQPYRGAQDYYQGYGYGNGYPRDNDDTYYADPSHAPTVNQWDE